MKAIIQQKVNDVEALAADLKTAKTIIAFEYHGANAKDITQVRRNLHNANAKIYVAKNNILNRAIKMADLKGWEELKGPNALIVAQGDEIIPFKELTELMKTYKQVVYKQGMMDNQMVPAEQVQVLATIPGREGLLSMLLSCLQAPVRNLAYALSQIQK